ncbi:MAG: 4'-phosphopantetheinyl transferase superfamily protein [Proteobacteria bacterium]|nr:4'-phosphopantetheinyl transferase superfamily protein [Pseudomonadota bacterium]
MFFRFWTLKEAYVKAKGKGLSIPLNQFSFHLKDNQPIGIACTDELHDDSKKWQFAQFFPTENHILSVCVQRIDGADTRLVMRTCTPLKN